MPNIALSFTDREMAALDAAAKQFAMSVNAVIRAAIKSYLQQERERQPVQTPTIASGGTDADIDEALSLIDDIQAMADEVPERGADFAESVRDKASDIGESIDRDGRVTANQIQALINMRDGLERWLR